MTERADVMYARPIAGVHEAAVRDLSSRAFKRAVRWLTDNPHLSSFNSVRLIRGPIARAAASVCSHDTDADIVL